MGLFDALRGKGSAPKGKASTQDLDQELSKVDDESRYVVSLFFFFFFPLLVALQKLQGHREVEPL